MSTSTDRIYYEQPDNPRCVFKVYDAYRSKLSDAQKDPEGKVFLKPRLRVTASKPEWYSTKPMSKQALSRMLPDMIALSSNGRFKVYANKSCSFHFFVNLYE